MCSSSWSGATESRVLCRYLGYDITATPSRAIQFNYDDASIHSYDCCCDKSGVCMYTLKCVGKLMNDANDACMVTK